MRKKVLVVGGAGYIGGWVTECLIGRDIPFTVYDTLMYEKHFLKPVDFIHGDVRDKKKLKALLPNYSHVVWLAAIVGDPACDLHPKLTQEVNQNAIKWLAENYNGRIIFASTVTVYGNNSQLVTEDTLTHPLSLYASTKAKAETYLANKNALIFRLGTAFGLSDNFSRIRMDLGINSMTRQAVEKKKLTLFKGSQWRSFIHVKDIGETIAYNIFNDKKGIYNLATTRIMMSEVAKLIKTVTKCSITKKTGTSIQESSYNISTEKAEKDQIFPKAKKRTILDGVEEIAELTRSGRVTDFQNPMYSNVQYLTETLKRHI